MVDRDGLENRCTGNRTEGSNPSLSANKGVNQQVMRFAPFIMPKKFLGISTAPSLFFTLHPSFATDPKKVTAASTRSRCRGYRNEIKILLFVDFLPAVFERYCAVEHKMLLRRVLFVGREVADALELEVCPRLCVLCEERLYLSVFHNFD